jgi:uncharacterized protein
MEALLVVASIAAALFLGGTVKGAVGFGVPLVSLPLMAAVVDIRTALALLTMPIVFGNVWQAFQGGVSGRVLCRFWWLLLAMTVGCALGALLIVQLEERYFFLAIGTIVIAFVLMNVSMPSIAVPRTAARSIGMVAGFVSGVMGGLSTIFSPPIVMYFFALRLRHEIFVAATGLVYVYASALLVVSYSGVGVLTWSLAVLSLSCVPPLIAGMAFGRWISQRVPQHRLRQAILAVLLLVGLTLIRKAWT